MDWIKGNRSGNHSVHTPNAGAPGKLPHKIDIGSHAQVEINMIWDSKIEHCERVKVEFWIVFLFNSNLLTSSAEPVIGIITLFWSISKGNGGRHWKYLKRPCKWWLDESSGVSRRSNDVCTVDLFVQARSSLIWSISIKAGKRGPYLMCICVNLSSCM